MESIDVLSVLFVGDASRAEFRAACQSLAEHALLTFAPDPAAAVGRLEAGESCDLIVIASARPGEFIPAEIDRLRRLAPLARILGLLGSWCEGEGRSGSPWPAVPRIYWHQWPARFAEEVRRLETSSPLWGLPLTATDEERLLAACDEPTGPRGGAIALVCRCFGLAEMLADACRQFGWQAVSVEPTATRLRGVKAVLWAGTDFNRQELEEFQSLRRAAGSVPILALLDFPRIEAVERARQAGAASVLSKPFFLGELRSELDRLLGQEPGADRRMEGGQHAGAAIETGSCRLP